MLYLRVSQHTFSSEIAIDDLNHLIHYFNFLVGRETKEKYHDRVGNWQNYDPSNIVISNEYANEMISGTKNNHAYPDMVMEDIIYADNIEDDIITEEYIASEEYSPG